MIYDVINKLKIDMIKINGKNKIVFQKCCYDLYDF